MDELAEKASHTCSLCSEELRHGDKIMATLTGKQWYSEEQESWGMSVDREMPPLIAHAKCYIKMGLKYIMLEKSKMSPH